MAKKGKVITRNESMPYVAAAFFCERIIIEDDDGVSLERMVTDVTASVRADSHMPTPTLRFPLKLYLRFWTGPASGEKMVSLECMTPSGKTEVLKEDPMLFDKETLGPAANLTVDIVAPEQGIYWFTIRVNRKIATRIPLRITYKKGS
jgi:hypothetical protein